MIQTSISECRLNKPTRDAQLNQLLAEVREATQENWQVVEYQGVRDGMLWGLFSEIYTYYGLYVEVGGILPYQELSCVNTAKEVIAYLCGVLTGLGTDIKEKQ